ncbi:protein PFC0760c [Leptopilina boulardi]|uniref:protein PFC0760c n=1 Tax=Leptopilina boulardi TaxID=63433 RepID=UPI0021F64DB2|nr:protein PFC0760c [Leptopilina boulardi]
MTKVRKVKKRKRFQANVNRKRLRNKLNKLPTIKCKQIKDAWEVKKSIKGNLKDMGLAADPNEIFKIPNTKRQEIENVSKVRATENFIEENLIKNPPLKVHVAESLEKEAKTPRERMFKLPKNQVQFITYMMDKYGDDYKAMTRDKKNYYQLTWKQIRAKVNTFKNIPEQYAEYLLEKGEIVLDDPTSLAESKKQQALENFQKHCISKKPKKEKKLFAEWEEESIQPIQDSGETNSDTNLEEDNNDTIQKKLNLFLDEENESENKSPIKGKGTVNEASNGILEFKSKKSKNNSNNPLKEEKITKKRTAEEEKKITKRAKKLEKSASSDSEDENEVELDGEEDNSEFVNLSDLSSDELSDDDVLDDGEFVTDSNDESD